MTKLRQYAGKASVSFVYLFLVVGFQNIIAGRLLAQPVSFVGAKTFSAGTNPVAVVAGDFNQDGNQDLAVANLGSNNVSVLLGNGDGTFQTAVNFPVGGSPNSIVMAYFNGDSIQDLAVANANPSPSLSVLLGNGNGTFQSSLNFPAGASAQSIDYGDFNGDHLWDLIVSTSGGFAVHLGNGNGTFRAPLNTAATGNFVAGYFNNDGILDVATAGPSVVLVRFGNGDGTFQPPVTSPSSAERPGRIAVGFFNRDAIADLAVRDSIATGRTGKVLLGNGDGTFRGEGSFSGPLGGLVVDDFDGDTIADLLIGGDGDVSVALGRGDGTFRSSVLSFRFGSAPVVGEFNGDGRRDLAATGGVALGYGDGTFQAGWNYVLGDGAVFDSNTRPLQGAVVALGEFNGDGIKDLAVVHAWVRRLSVLLGNGDGSFQWAFDYYPLASVSNLIAVGEFNRDGIQDLVIGPPGAVFLGNGNGTFRPPLDFPTATGDGGVTVGYFNGDGFQDLAVIGRSDNRISVLLGNGDGTFQAPLSFDTGGPPPGFPTPSRRALAVGDFNGDGSQDLAATNYPATSISVLLGNGDGTFRAPLIFDVGGSGPRFVYSLAVGDFNNDHVQDLAVGIDGPFGSFSILLGNGNGTFGMPSFFSLGAGGGIGSIAVGDFNSDGIHDLILGVGHPFSTGLWVLVGNGDATFQPPVGVSVGTTGASFAIGLLSGDGRPDIAVGGCRVTAVDSCVSIVSVLINNPSVSAPAQITSPTPGSTLTSSTTTFTWNTGTSVSQYWLYVGTAQGGNQLYDQNRGTNLSAIVTGLPTNGSTIYVRLWSKIGSNWLFVDYTYRAKPTP